MTMLVFYREKKICCFPLQFTKTGIKTQPFPLQIKLEAIFYSAYPEGDSTGKCFHGSAVNCKQSILFL